MNNTGNGGVALTERLLHDEPNYTDAESNRGTLIKTRASAVPTLGDGKSTANGRTSIMDEEAQFNFELTFRYMTGRRLQRRYQGVYKQYSFTAQLVTWVIVLYTLSVLATLAFGVSYAGTSETSTTADSIFYVVLILLVVYVFVRVALVIRWMVYWVIVAAMVGYATTGEIASLFWLNDPKVLNATQRKLRSVVIALLIVAECLTVVVYLFTHHMYPYLVLSNKFNTIAWWDVQRHATKSNTITYRSRARSWYTRKRNEISYCGGLDDQLRPHGYGMWTDTSFHGERLTGQWEHGIPIGPFRSFEHGSGYCFVDIRIGYCHIRAEPRPDQIWFWPQHSRGGSGAIHWGVASVECSVSGGFFTFLPAVRHQTPYHTGAIDAATNAKDCVTLLRSPTDFVTFHEPKTKTLQNDKDYASTKRFQSAKRLLFKENSMPMLDPTIYYDMDQRRSLSTTSLHSSLHSSPSPGGDRKEALILLHGYNCSLNYGMNRLAQLMALGDFPTYVHPFVFSWPSGGALAYFQARDIGSQSDETAQGFRDFLRGLIQDGGYTTIHLLAHSMGARVYFHCLEKHFLDDLFEPVQQDHPGDDDVANPLLFLATDQHPERRRAQLATLTFANADYERNAFVKRGGSYDKSSRLCKCITVYADNMDGALFYSEIFSKKSVFGPLNYSLGKRGHMIHRDPHDQGHAHGHGDDHSSGDGDVDGTADTAVVVVPSATTTPMATEMDLAIALVNQRGHFEGVTSFAYNRRRQRGRLVRSPPPQAETAIRVEDEEEATSSPQPQQPPQEQERKSEYLDVDVIDTTWMDNNVHAIRHNYFNLNPTVVDDLRCLVVTKQRAASRAGLLKTAENVYIFLVAPSHVKNK